MTGELFHKSMKLAEMIDTDCRLLYVLPRFGIRLGFGDATIEEVCGKHGISEEVFLMVCNTYAFEHYTPRLSEMGGLPLEAIMLYLARSHSDYLNKRIPHILEHIQSLADESHSRQKDIIEQFCESYKREMVEHFNYEEKTVFPYIASLISGNRDDRYRIEDFLDNHSNIDDKLHDLKSIIMKYVEPKDDASNRDLLLDIYLLEEDLERHTKIEEKILAALAESIERSH